MGAVGSLASAPIVLSPGTAASGVVARAGPRNWGDTMLRVHSLLDMVMENARQLKRMSQRVDHTCGELEAGC